MEEEMRACGSSKFHIDFSREDDGRWIADVPEFPGVTVYGNTQQEAEQLAVDLVTRVITDRLIARVFGEEEGPPLLT